MPSMRYTASKTLAALLALILAAGVASASTQTIIDTALHVAAYLIEGDYEAASIYSTRLCKLAVSEPPGLLRGNESLARMIAFLSAVTPRGISVERAQLVYLHLVGIKPADPSVCGALNQSQLFPPQSLPRIQQGVGVEDVERYKRLVSTLNRLVSAITTGSVPEATPESTSITSVHKPLEEDISLEEARRIAERVAPLLAQSLEGKNQASARQAPLLSIDELLKRLLESRNPVNAFKRIGPDIGSVFSSIAGREAPRIFQGFRLPGGASILTEVPGAPGLRVPNLSLPSIPPVNTLYAVVAIAVVLGLAVLAPRASSLLALVKSSRAGRVGVVHARDRLVLDERGRIVMLFAQLLDVLAAVCRPKLPGETHREYARVIGDPEYRKLYAAAMQAYEECKFGGRCSSRAAEAIRRAIREARGVECRG